MILHILSTVLQQSFPLMAGQIFPAQRFANFHNEDWYLKNVDVELAWEESHICIPGANKELGALWLVSLFKGLYKGFGLTS